MIISTFWLYLANTSGKLLKLLAVSQTLPISLDEGNRPSYYHF